MYSFRLLAEHTIYRTNMHKPKSFDLLDNQSSNTKGDHRCKELSQECITILLLTIVDT